MRLFIEMIERETVDPQEKVAMLKHRLASCKYQLDLIKEGKLIYSFKSKEGNKTFMGVEVSSFEELDYLIKADPLFPYSYVNSLPVIPLKHLVEEIHNYIGEVIMSDEEVEKLEHPPTLKKQPGESYFFAKKVVKPFSPLLSEEEQKDIARRTVLAQAYHWTELEVYDENPVGQPVGLLIAKAKTAEEVISHVSECEVYPDTEMDVIPLDELEECIKATENQLQKLRPELDSSKYILANDNAKI